MTEQKRQFAYGYVKAVMSGDCLILLGGGQQEKMVVLSGIQAPKFARSKNNAADEPYAWESREFLRKKCIGKQVAFHTIAGAGTGREYCNVFLDHENLTEVVVKAGMATVKLPPSTARISAEKEALIALQEEAQAQGRGIFAKTPQEDHVRNIDWSPDAKLLYNKYKNKPVPAVISQIRDGTTLRCEVLGYVKGPSKQGRDVMIVNLCLAGALSPRIPISLDYRMSQHEKAKADNPAYDGPEPEEETAAPFATEALHFVETRLLNRDVHIIILGLDMSNNVYGTVKFPKGNITLKLLENGLATYVPWTGLMTEESKELKEAFESAKAAKKGLAAAAADEEEQKEFTGKVVFIVSGDTIHVDDGENEHRISLASIRGPRINRRERNEAGALEAREHLRKRYIGKKVRVITEYTRTSINGGDDRVYATVKYGDTNVGVDLVAAGLASVIPHRQSEPRSIHYAKLMEAQVAAEKQGLRNKKNAPQIVDLTDRPRGRKGADGKEEKDERPAPGTGKARAFLPFLQRETHCTGIVEYVFTGSRLKVFVPKENCMIALALVGLKCPRPSEDFGTEALRFIRSKCLQHQVRIQVETIDRGDNFIGSVWLGHTNLGVELLREGLAQLMRSADRSPQFEELQKAEAEAKEAKKKIWENHVEQAVIVEDENNEETKGLKDAMEVKITEITDACSFYFQVNDDENVAKVTEAMLEFSPPEPLTEFPRKGEMLAALYTDDSWYRVKTEGKSGEQVRVNFIDFGNHDVVDLTNLRALPEELTRINGLARSAVLAGVRAPTKASEHFDGAAITFNDVAYDRDLTAKVECVGKDGKLHLSLFDKEEPETSINSMLIRDGWCRVMERPEWKLKGYCAALKKDEDVAKQARMNIWEYGDVSDEEEEDTGRVRFDGRTGKPLTR